MNDKAKPVTIDLGVVLKDGSITSYDDANASYLYRIDFSSDVNGKVHKRIVELVHQIVDEI